jgi:hypothetical protein
VIGDRTLLLVIALLLVAGKTSAELNIVKDFRYPTLRTSIFNPQSLPNNCTRRDYRVLHRRDAEGRAYDIEVVPIGSAERELIPSVVDSFTRWRFKVPLKDDWRAEFLAMTHENVFWTMPPCECDASCDETVVDEETRALIERVFDD